MSRLEKKILCVETVEQSSSNNPGTIANETLVSSSNDERMRLEVEPTLRFRGRTPGDFKRKKATNGDGEELTARPPRYFADRNGKTCLYLLVCLGFFNCSIDIIIFFRFRKNFSRLMPNIVSNSILSHEKSKDVVMFIRISTFNFIHQIWKSQMKIRCTFHFP